MGTIFGPKNWTQKRIFFAKKLARSGENSTGNQKTGDQVALDWNSPSPKSSPAAAGASQPWLHNAKTLGYAMSVLVGYTLALTLHSYI